MFTSEPIHQPWGVSVSGHAVVEAAPDRARIHLGVRRVAASPAEAFAAARAGRDAVTVAAYGQGLPDSAVAASRLSLFEMDPHNKMTAAGGGRLFECRSSLVIEIDSLDLLEPVIVAALAAGADEIGDIAYDCRDLPALQDRARRAAVADARARAEVFADSVGVRLGRVVHLREAEREGRAMAFSSAGGAHPGGAAPVLVTVVAEVLLGLAIED